MPTMVRVLKCTVVVDISGLPATLSRYDVAKAIDERFSHKFTVKSVQFMPGKRVQVAFEGPEAKADIEQFEHVTICDIACSVVRSGPRVQNVPVYHYPFEDDKAPLLVVLSGFGEGGAGHPSSALPRFSGPVYWYPSCTNALPLPHTLYSGCRWVCS